jgi:hypothetical protein
MYTLIWTLGIHSEHKSLSSGAYIIAEVADNKEANTFIHTYTYIYICITSYNFIKDISYMKRNTEGGMSKRVT